MGVIDIASDRLTRPVLSFSDGGGANAKLMYYHFGGETASNTAKNIFSL